MNLIERLFLLNRLVLAAACKTAVILFQAELQGQISDGFWENSSPSNHWEIPSLAEVVVSDEPHLDFCPSRGYKFHNKALFEVVGNRMIFYVKLYTAFPQLDITHHHTHAHLASHTLRQTALREGLDSFWGRALREIEEATGMTFEEAQALVEAQEYTPRQCRSDLRQISEVFKLARK